MNKYGIHPLCDLVPPSTPKEYDELIKSMTESGYDPRFPIIIYEGMILDGRHRARAAYELGITPTVIEWEPRDSDTAAKFVLRAQVRRNLTASQRAALAVALLPELEKEAEKREKAGKSDPGAILPQGSRSPKSTQIAAKEAGASEQYVKQAKKLKETAPEVFEQVKAGNVSIQDAKKAIEKNANPPPPQRVATPKDEAGNKITGNLIKVFREASQYDTLINEIHALKRKLTQFAESEIGRTINVTSVEAAAKGLAASIRTARPHAKCPYKTCNTIGCKACNGSGWVTKQQYDVIPDDLK